MIGVCIDYPMHYFAHHVVAPAPAGPTATLARVWPGLVVGAVTTTAGFAGLALTSFPGIREVGVFGSVGVATALVATRVLLPPLVPRKTPRPLLTRRMTTLATALMAGLGRHRRLLVLAPVGALALCLAGLPRLTWVDDATVLNRLEPELLHEDDRVRDLVSRVDTGRFVIAVGETEEAALERNDIVHRRLTELAARGATSFSSLHQVLWSAELQRRNLAMVQHAPRLAERALQALEAEGFRREAFAGLADALAATPEPLDFAEISRSPLEPIASPYRVVVGDDTGYLTFLRDVQDPRALRASLADVDGIVFWDQRTFMETAYSTYRQRVLDMVLLGLIGVAVVVLARYRRAADTAAALMPALLAAAVTMSLLALAEIPVHIIHVMGLLMVLSIGVDYGVFLVESTRHSDGVSATVMSLVIACLSTVSAFGLLALSANPALRAVGLTTGLGVLTSLVLAPTTLVLTGVTGRSR
jgi:predicted exporter